MGEHSTIEWTDATWNPVVGCTKVSPGCDHCYAESMHERFYGKGSFATVSLKPDRLDQPLHWAKPRRVFVNSMSDLFHVAVDDEYIGRVFDVMSQAPRHQFQILTKRAERMERFVSRRLDPALRELPNVWLGVSVESSDYYSRIRHHQRTPAAVRFLSCEPLLGRLKNLPLSGIDWVIVGGESGPGARPMHPDWVAEIRDQCVRSGAAFFFKQWGAWEPIGPVYCFHEDEPDAPECDCEDVNCVVFEEEQAGRDVRWLTVDGYATPSTMELQPGGLAPHWVVRRSKRATGRLFEGRTWDGMPEPRLQLITENAAHA